MIGRTHGEPRMKAKRPFLPKAVTKLPNTVSVSLPLQPINDRVLVRLFEHPSEEQKIGSIIVPEIAREKENICGSQVFLDKPMHRGTVVATGPGALVNLTCKGCGDEKIVRREMSVKPGDIIYFGHFFDLSIDNLILLREDDILGVEA